MIPLRHGPPDPNLSLQHGAYRFIHVLDSMQTHRMLPQTCPDRQAVTNFSAAQPASHTRKEYDETLNMEKCLWVECAVRREELES